LLDLRHSQTGSEKKWALALEKKIARALRLSQSGVLIWGGEPQIAISKKSKGKGGRQTQIAARLALRFWREILQGRVEILCASSDGRDGTSGSAATRLNARVLRSMNKLGPSLQRQLKKAIARYDTAPFLERHGALIAAYSTGTNLQDIVLIRINPSTNP
jgi:glycerate-2-kinase